MIRQVDRDLAAGDHEAARAALERPLLWQAGELQSAARLAEIYLLKPEPDLFRKRQALAFFRHVYDPGNESPDLALPGLAWEASRLEEVAERARVWLASRPGDFRSRCRRSTPWFDETHELASHVGVEAAVRQVVDHLSYRPAAGPVRRVEPGV
jgi:hypothetical protein